MEDVLGDCGGVCGGCIGCYGGEVARGSCAFGSGAEKGYEVECESEGEGDYGKGLDLSFARHGGCDHEWCLRV